MDVTYTPEGETAQTWNFNSGRVRTVEAEQIEARSGMRYEEWVLAIQAGGARARRVLLWHLMRRDHPKLRFEDTPDFYMDELVLEYDATELRELLARLDDPSIELDEEAASKVRVLLTAEIEAAESRGDLGKAPASPDSETPTA